MATFRRRGGKWQAIVRRKGYGQVVKTFGSKTDAESWAKIAESEMIRGVFVSRTEAERTTLGEALGRYADEVTALKKGRVQELSRIRILKSSPLSVRSLSSIAGKDIANYRDARLKEVSSGTVLRDLAMISHLYTVATKEWGMTGLVNPVSQIRKPKLPQGRDRRLLPGEMDRILAASDSPVLTDLARFAVETGMRRGELAGMTWDLVDIKKRTATLPKTKSGEKRVVPLSAEAVRILSGLDRRIDGTVWGMPDHAVSLAW